MKFNQKLIELRKKKGLSQEELGYELSVTRQTISKWELGLSTPDMDKLMEISRFFNISIDDLTNENKDTNTNSTNNSSRVNPEFVGVNTDYIPEDQKTKQYVEEAKKRTKYLMFLPLLIPIIFFVFFIIFGISSFNDFKKSTDSTNITNLVEDISKNKNSLDLDALELSADVLSYNSTIEITKGITCGFFIRERIIDTVINKPNDVKETVIVYNDISAKTESELIELRNKIPNSPTDDYFVSLEYSSEGYINKIIIKDIQQ